MRKLVWAATGFASAAFLAEYLLPIQGLPYIAAALAVCSPLLLPWKRGRRQAMTLVLAAAVGLMYWWGWFELRVAPCEALSGQDITVEARVTDWPLVREDYTRLSVTVTDGAPHERAYIYVYHADVPELVPGDIIACELRIRSAMLRGEERAHTATAAGRFMIGYSTGDIAVTGRSSVSWIYFPQRIARYVGETCRALFPERTGVFMKALLTGDKEELYADAALYGDMRAAGVLHAVAVSGMHVFILIEFIRLLFGRGRRTTLLCLPVMAVFVLMSGAGPSVVRAALMQTVYMGAPLVKRESDSPSGLAAALLLLLLMNPMSIGGISLQLSFACMTGYAFLMPRLIRAIGQHRRIVRCRPLHFVSLNLASTVSATAFSIPVAAYYFGAVPLLSPAANLLALPVIEILFAGGYAVCALNALVPFLARWAAWLLTWGVRWCLLVFRAVACVPFACVFTADPAVVVWLAVSYALVLAWLGLRRKRRVRPAIVASLVLIGLALVLLRQEIPARLGRSAQLAVLDVGQGECAVLLDGDAVVVTDCGGSGRDSAGNTAADWLCARGRKHIDLLVLTHLDDDHVNGVETLLYRLPVGGILIPAAAEAEDAEELRALAARYNVPVAALSEPCTAELGELSLELLPLDAGSDDNDRGIVVLARTPARSALIMGDAGEASERALLAAGFVPDVDILVAGHHGSAGASSALFLRAAQAETAVVSVGSNSFGLPAEAALERLTEYCGQVLRTDEDGTVVLPLRDMEGPWQK